MKIKVITFLLLICLSLSIIVDKALAQGGGFLSFGIRPTNAFEDRPESFSYFSHVLEPGAVINDEALVLNEGDLPVTLTLYAADGLTAENGGTSFAVQGQSASGASQGVSAWLSFSVSQISLNPGEELLVPFSITVPQDAKPGQYIAGLVLEAPPSAGSVDAQANEGTQFAVAVIRRVGVAVLIDVPGEKRPGLVIQDAGLFQQNAEGATFFLDLHNTGNIILNPVGILKILTTDQVEIISLPFELDSILPGDLATFKMTHPVSLSDGDYLINMGLIYSGGEISNIEGVKLNVRDGQPSLNSELEPILEAPVIEILQPLSEQIGLWDWLNRLPTPVTIGFGLFFLATIAFEIIILRRLWKR